MSPFRVAIDVHPAERSHHTGTERYTYELIRAMQPITPSGVTVTAYTKQDDAGHFISAPWLVKKISWPLPMWSQVRLAGQIIADRPDITFVPGHIIPPLAGRFSATHWITTVHDVAFQKHPELYFWGDRFYLRRALAWALRYAERIIVPSECVADELRSQCRRSAQIVVIPHGVRDIFCELPPSQVDAVLEHHHLSSPYFLHVGRVVSKKNLDTLIEAYRLFTQAHPGVLVPLVFAGPVAADWLKKFTAIIGVRSLGWVSEPDLVALLNGASALLLPSMAEGFGLPILEAMAVGTPVIAPAAGATAEVAGSAALLVIPNSARAFADAMHTLVTDFQAHHELGLRGRARARLYTWSATAERTWATIMDLGEKIL